ncbi:MAG TPA: hypothetical protein VGX51_01205 [Solirubrobacteraceae bacterium]|jgi:hypothetical protein|nr:hypothetical protein [Solirubrobacteraceae bacterium]
MPSATAPRLGELLADVPRLALVGLAKNTGKTETLAAILADHARAGRAVAVTSIGRDGERRDVIDERIAKPPVQLQEGWLVATTGPLLRAGGVAYERLLDTHIRTPLGEVVVARMTQPGEIEVAGPSVAQDVRSVSDAMLSLGAQQVLIDGAVDRRAASSPAVADGLVMATGAVLGHDVNQVVAATADAVEIVRLGQAQDCSDALALERGVVLGAEPAQIAQLLASHPDAGALLVRGALGEGFLQALLGATRGKRQLRVIVEDHTRVFLSEHAPAFYARQGVSIEVLASTELVALTVNPVAPQSHSLDSRALRDALRAVAGDVPVIDVREPAPA